MVNPEQMTDEEIEAFNKQEAAKMEKRKDRQAMNRRKPRAKKVEFAGTKKIGKGGVICICVRKIGTDDGMAEVGEEIDLEREIAAKLQDSGAIKVKL